jgi:hypothetical protein
LALLIPAGIALVSLCIAWMILKRVGCDQSTSIRWPRVGFAATLIGLVVWPIWFYIQSFMLESMVMEITVFEAPLWFGVESGLLSPILALLITRRRRLDHMVLIFLLSGPIALVALVALVAIRSIIHR